MKEYPKEYFSSYEEYDTYFTCLSKVRQGDSVEIYLDESKYPTSRIANKTAIVTVIGREISADRNKFNTRILLGSNDRIRSFWTLWNRIADTDLSKDDAQFARNFNYAFWAIYFDVRIARIIKVDNDTLKHII